MKFNINNDKWQIKELCKDELVKMYEDNMKEEAYFVFGLTQKSEHIIYINKEMCFDQKIKTLKHELTHCYIWEYGLYYVDNINEELLCDIVASSNDFINGVVKDYTTYKKAEEQ